MRFYLIASRSSLASPGTRPSPPPPPVRPGHATRSANGRDCRQQRRCGRSRAGPPARCRANKASSRRRADRASGSDGHGHARRGRSSGYPARSRRCGSPPKTDLNSLPGKTKRSCQRQTSRTSNRCSGLIESHSQSCPRACRGYPTSHPPYPVPNAGRVGSPLRASRTKHLTQTEGRNARLVCIAQR